LEVSVTEYSGQPVQVYWDGTDANGRELHSGIYPFTFRFSRKDGTSGQTYGKIAVLR
jgi:hypothetical protein